MVTVVLHMSSEPETLDSVIVKAFAKRPASGERAVDGGAFLPSREQLSAPPRQGTKPSRQVDLVRHPRTKRSWVVVAGIVLSAVVLLWCAGGVERPAGGAQSRSHHVYATAPVPVVVIADLVVRAGHYLRDGLG